MNPIALIAEDDFHHANALQAMLVNAWPDLKILTHVTSGSEAVSAALHHRPDVLFLDIGMPGLSGLEVATVLARQWSEGEPFPAIVFVTGFVCHALEAFEVHAVDYLVKPVRPDRLAITVQRLKEFLAKRSLAHNGTLGQVALADLRQLLRVESPRQTTAAQHLQRLTARKDNTRTLVPINEVLMLKSDNKYVDVTTLAGETVQIRITLSSLLKQLDPSVFWQVRRGIAVRADAIRTVTRNETGGIELSLRGLKKAVLMSQTFYSIHFPS